MSRRWSKETKVVCVCVGGNNRSGAMAFILKCGYDVDALAVGVGYNSRPTQEMLFKWADHIVVMHDVLMGHIPDEYVEKTLVCNVGVDIWTSPKDPDLLNTIKGIIREWPELHAHRTDEPV